VGRGGWTWYTGAAGWMQRAGVESILGLTIRDGTLHLDPCIPMAWPKFEATVRHRSAHYEILVENPLGVRRGVAHAQLDGVEIAERPVSVHLKDDGGVHQLSVQLG
jgi:cyclic beta-1,2-glucan synthetase